MKPLAIIGLDPGTTSAYAILDLQGNILQQHAAKELTLSEMITRITELCFPLIASTDKAKVPSFVEEFSRKLGVEIIAPPTDLKREEKRIMLLAKEIHYNGAHEQDAAAAALFAYQRYVPKLRKMERFITANHLGGVRDEFIRIALREKLHFSLIRQILTRPAVESTVMQRAVLENRITKKDFLALYAKLSQLREEKEQLERKLREAQEKIGKLAREKGDLSEFSADIDRHIDTFFHLKDKRLQLQEKEMLKQQDLIIRLGQQINGLYRFIEQSPGQQLVKKLPTLGKKDLEARRFSEINFRPGEAVLVGNPDIYSEKVIKSLQELGVMVLSLQKINNPLGSALVTARIAAEDIALENEFFCLIDPALIKQKISQKDLAERVVKEYRESRQG